MDGKFGARKSEELSGAGSTYVALYSYSAEKFEDLSFTKGEGSIIKKGSRMGLWIGSRCGELGNIQHWLITETLERKWRKRGRRELIGYNYFHM